MIANRGVPVVFLQSDFGYSEPGTPYNLIYKASGKNHKEAGIYKIGKSKKITDRVSTYNTSGEW
jgi:hypothetical protein